MKIFASTFIASALLRVFVPPICSVLGEWCFPFLFIIVFLLVFLVLRKYGTQQNRYLLLAAVLAGLFLTEIGLRIITHIPLVNLIFLLWLGISVLAGFVFYEYKKVSYRTVILLFCIGFIIFYTYRGNTWFCNKFIYGTFNGEVEKIIDQPLLFTDAKKSIYRTDSLSQDAYLVMCTYYQTDKGWYSSEHAEYERLYSISKNKNNMRIFGLSVLFRNKIQPAARQWLVPVPILATVDNTAIDILGINTDYPTVVVIKNNKLIYRGSPASAKLFLEKQIH